MAGSESHDSGWSPDIEKLASQLEKDPRSRAFIPLAEEYAKAGMLQEAATVLEDGLKVYPTFVTALVALGRVYVQMDQTLKALKVLEEAVKISPDNLLAHRILARLYVKQLSWDLARRSCDRVLFEYPKDQEMLLLKSEIDASATPDTPPPASPMPRDPAPQEEGSSSPLQASAEPAPADRPEPVTAATPDVATSERAAASASTVNPAPAADPAVDPRVERLQSLLARIQARRPS